MSARRVLYVDFYSFIGGGQVNLLSLFQAMDRSRYEPSLVLPSEGPFAERARALGVSVSIVPMGKARWRWLFRALGAFFGLRRLMQEGKIDLVHANCYPANKLAGPAAASLGIPCIWHKQIAVRQKPGSTTGRLWRFFSRFDQRVLAVSLQGFEALAALGIPREKLRLIYNNADTERLAKAEALPAAELQALGLAGRGPLVLAAGMRRPHKGFDVFLKAARLVKAPCHFVLLGDPTPSEAAHEALLQELAAASELQGRLSVLAAAADLAPWLKSAALFVSSSRWEGSPLVVFEAMAASKPIVATRSGSGEILEDGKEAWLCESEDAAGLAHAIEAALADPAEAARRGQAAREKVSAKYSLAHYGPAMAALYDEVLA